ncbi:MAG: glycosyltransferase [Verrucomicrobia bacterium]|nr:glycosyltransferase [Verrucomicrobiota bacterium]
MPFRFAESRFARDVSVIIPCRDGAAFLPACLDSILKQERGYVPREIIVVDDSSRDSTSEVVRRYRKRSRRIRYFRIEEGNANRARIFGLSMSRGRRILLLDVDNWLEPDFVRKCASALMTRGRNGSRPAFAYGDRIMHYEASWHPDYDPEGSDVTRVEVGDFDPDRLRRGNYIDTCSMLWRTSVQLDPSLRTYHDWDLWLRLLEQNQVGKYVPDTAFHYRVHDRNHTRARVEGARDPDFEKVVRRYRLQPWITAEKQGTDKPPKISIVLVAKTDAEIEEKMRELRKQAYPSFEFCTSTAPGLAEAFQEAVDKATGDIIVFTETDCSPLNENWLTELAAAVVPNAIVHGVTITDTTPNMSNTAGPADLIRKFVRNSDFGNAEDTEWFLRLQAAGVEYRQLDLAPVLHARPIIRKAMLGRAYRYGRDWVRLSEKYGYVTVEELVERFRTEKAIAEEVLRGIEDELSRESCESCSQIDKYGIK